MLPDTPDWESPPDWACLTAKAIVRTLEACGDNVEKKERFVAAMLHNSVESHR